MMDNISLRLRSFKLHLIIPKNLRNRLVKTITLIYVPRTSGTLLEINGAKIPPNKPAPIVLRQVRLAEAESDTEVMYSSIDQVFASDGLQFVVNGLECVLISLKMWMEISIMTDHVVLIRQRVKLRRNQSCQKLSVIKEEDEEGIVEESNNLKHEHGIDDGNKAVKKGVSWAINTGVFIAVLGVGSFIFKASLKRLVR